MIDNFDELTKLIIMVMQCTVIYNAKYYGWKAEVSSNIIILTKKKCDMTELDNNMSALIDTFFNREQFERTKILM